MMQLVLAAAVPTRYAGVVMWFVFRVLQLLPIGFTQQNSCCISKSMMKHPQKPDGSAWLLIS